MSDGRDTARLRNHTKWFLFARVLITSCLLGGVACIQIAAGDSRYPIPTNWLLVTIAVAYAVSIVSALLLLRIRRLKTFVYLQIGIDVALTTAAVFLTGGVESPFTFLYALAIFNAAILLQSRGAAVAAIFVAVAYTLLVTVLTPLWGDFGPQLAAPVLDASVVSRLLIHNASFFILAYLAGVLTQRLRDTELLLSEERDEHDRLARLQETLARNIGCGLLTTDADGRITSANTTLLELISMDSSLIIKRDIGSVFPPLHLTSDRRLAFLQSERAAQATEFSLSTSAGKDLLLRCSAAPLHDTYRHPIGALYIVQDVTSLRQIEQQYNRDGNRALDAAAEALDDADEDDAPLIDGFVGRSPGMQQVRALITKVAPSDATVLLCGESGTGKEVAARAIHAKSGRKERPFIAINCGAIPEHLVESELFGHVKGAFTGAVCNRPGFFRSADGGTVFLDEIGELPLPMQVKLLRVLQERVFKPVGSETHVAVNVRVITATNRDLAARIRAGRFREDLFYRLNVITIELPPLRERRVDIPLLIRHFLRDFSELHRKRVVRVSVPAARRLLDHGYPGNVRELANIIEHAVTMSDGETVHEAHLPAHLFQAPHLDPTPQPAVEIASAPDTAKPAVPAPPINGMQTQFDNLDQYLADHEKAIILRALERSGGVKKRAADLLGINYRSFRHRLSKYGLQNGDSHASMDD